MPSNTIVGGAGADTLVGGPGSELLLGGGGNDSLVGGGGYDALQGQGGDDTLSGGDGGDQLVGGPGNDVIDGGAGFDRAGYAHVTVGGVTVDLTLQGAPQNTGGAGIDTLINIENVSGTFQDDVLTGDGGSNWLWGLGGNDTINGGGGDDLIQVGAGNSLVDGGSGVDTASFNDNGDASLRNVTVSLEAQGAPQATGHGSVTLTGFENLSGTAGDDALTGDGAANLLAGSGGADSLSGGGGDDTLLGDGIVAVDTSGAGTSGPVYVFDDVEGALDGVDGNDTLAGGDGADTLWGGRGDDLQSGGAGADVFVIGLGQDVITDFSVGEDRFDISIYGFSSFGQLQPYLTEVAGSAVLSFTYGGVVNTTTFQGVAAATLTGANFIFASAPNDLDGSDQSDLLPGTAGADTLTAYGGADTLVGFEGNDSLVAGDGADVLDGGTGADTMVGGLGDDTYVVESGGDAVFENGGEGTDTIRTSLSFFSLTNVANVENLAFTGDGDFTGRGNSLDNLLQGGAGADNLQGGAGNDTVLALAGADFLRGGPGDDVLDGGDGGDRVSFFDFGAPITVDLNLQGTAQNTGQGMDTLINIENVSGTAFDDALTGDANANWLWGLGGNDTLRGGGGDDLIQAASGDNVLEGGDGVDTASFNTNGDNSILNIAVSLAAQGAPQATGHGAMTLTGFENLSGGDGADTLGGDDSANLLAGNLGGDSLSGGAGGDTLLGDGAVGIDGNTGSAAVFNDVAPLAGQPGGADTLDGGAGADTMVGGSGDDVYVVDDAGDKVVELSGEGADTIRTTLASYSLASVSNVENLVFAGTGAFSGAGDSGANLIAGGAGGDTLDGAGGDDTMVGGQGDDTFVVDSAGDVVGETAGGGNDTIRTGLASYSLAGLPDVENLAYTGSGSFAGTGNDASNGITGGSGADTLNGGVGADTLTGGAGDDTFVVDNAGDVVSEGVGGGTDTVQTTLSAYNLAAAPNVENLIYAGVGSFLGVGTAGSNLIVGGAGDDTLDGNNGNDTLVGGAGNDVYLVDASGDVVTEGAGGEDTIQTTLTSYSLAALQNVENLAYSGNKNFSGVGNAAANVLTSGAGNDTLDGGLGADTMHGGSGNDTYVVDSAGDVVDDAGGGVDTIQTTLTSFSLATQSNVENLTYSGAGNFSGVGNAAANVLTGGAGNDTLDGGLGADTMIGGAGNDTYVVDNAGDAVTEGNNGGVDTVQTSLAAFSLANLSNVENLAFTGLGNFAGTGDAGDNAISGGAGNDTLDGGKGADTLSGGGGDDTYVVDSAQDLVVEQAGGGIDTVRTSLASYTLQANVENAIYTGAKAFSVVGNGDANNLTGGAGGDTLNGGSGADTLAGGAGDDTYVVDNTGDLVVEGSGAGVDTIQTTLGVYSLAGTTNVENLTFTGAGGFAGSGNGLGNVLTGGGGADTLNGGAGADTLTGGAGADMFVFDNLPAAPGSVDRITDFTPGTDHIALDHTIFTSLGAAGALNSTMLRAGNSVTTAADPNDFLIYNSKTGALYYDPDGSGAAAPVQIALIAGSPTLTSLDFVVT